MAGRVTFEGSPITLEDVRGFVQSKVDELFDLKPDGATCARVVNFLSDEIEKMHAKAP